MKLTESRLKDMIREVLEEQTDRNAFQAKMRAGKPVTYREVYAFLQDSLEAFDKYPPKIKDNVAKGFFNIIHRAKLPTNKEFRSIERILKVTVIL